MPIIIKSPEDLAQMRRAGQVNALALAAACAAVRPGVTTAELDRIAARVIREHGGTPAFLHYPNPAPGGPAYPATINASIDAELVHGLPSKRRLREGEIISIDVGTVLGGFVGDSAVTVPVGNISAEARALLEVTERALWLGIEASRVGNRFGDVSATIQEYAESLGYGVVREYTGHGVGREMHEDPQIPNWGKRDRGAPLHAGMTFALEPMLVVGSPDLRVKRDGWTVTTVSGNLCAHFEHTIAVTDGEPIVLTAL
ncbi:MAG: type I methionyl aminopeptidase [Anaerolineae bacterium]|nr:type I methionyl aminopeptidase [Chloroflexota bacterium]